jgi:hypothetical protein
MHTLASVQSVASEIQISAFGVFVAAVQTKFLLPVAAAKADLHASHNVPW